MTRSTPLGAITVALFGFCSMAHSAVTADHCELRVAGKSYLNGRCPVVTDKTGITVNVGRKGVPLTYFAYIDLNADGTATASWNADKGSLHAWKPLGAVTHEGECWINDHARICAGK